MPTLEAMYTFFIERVRKNLHVVFCMSPVGESFRNRLRQYPAFVSCTTIDWFSEWPRIALLEVANKFLKDVNFVETITGELPVNFKLNKIHNTKLSITLMILIILQEGRRRESMAELQEKLRESVASIFSIVHDSVSKMSVRMLDEMKRHNYVTPTNYLELVTGYKA